MDTVVCLKLVPTMSDISVSRSQGKFFENKPRMLSDEDKTAMSLAVSKKTGKVIGVGVCPAAQKDLLKEAIAWGLDEVHCIALDDAQPPSVANALASFCHEHNAGAIFCGAQSIERNCGEVVGRLAAALGWELKTDGFSDASQVVWSVAKGAVPLQLPNALKIMKSAKAQVQMHEAVRSPADMYLRHRIYVTEGS